MKRQAIVATVLSVAVASVARADITLLNQFANAGPGTIPVPISVNVSTTGTVYASSWLTAEGAFTSMANLYSSDGTFQAPFAPGPGNVSISEPEEGAFSTTGNLYVADSLGDGIAVVGTNGVIQGSLATGQFVGVNPFGLAIDSGGSLYATNTVSGVPKILMFNSSGTLLNSFAVSSDVQWISVDSANHLLYAAEPSVHKIEVYTTAGLFQSTIGNPTSGTPGYLNGGSLTDGFAISGTGRLYAADNAGGLQVFSTDGTYLETVATTINGQTFQANSVAVSPTGMVYAAGIFSFSPTISAGVFRFFDPASWISGTNAFTNSTVGPTSVAVGAGGLLGTTLTLDASKGLSALTLGVNNGGVLNLSGGSLSTGPLNVDGTSGGASFTMTGGSLSATAINVSGGGVAAFVGSPINIILSAGVSVSGAGSQFKVDQGANFTSSSLSNSGQVIVGANADYIVQSSVINGGAMSIAGGGLDIRGSLSNSTGSTLQLGGQLTTLIGLSNSGLVQMSGNAHVFGQVTNNNAATITISGLQPNVFHNKVINNGTIIIDSGSSASFEGVYSGANGTSGGGIAFIDGTLEPGDPVTETFTNLQLNSASQTILQFGGAGNGQFDKVHTTGQLTLGGTLQLLLNGFQPQAGQSFDLFDWGSLSGKFNALAIPILPAPLGWDTSKLYSNGVLAVTNTMRGDLNRDGQITVADIATLMIALSDISAYQSTHPDVADMTHLLDVADVNGDGVINNADVQVLINLIANNANGGGTISAVPEPTSIYLFSFGAFAILAARSSTKARSAFSLANWAVRAG